MSMALSWALSMATGAQAAPCRVPIRLKASQEATIRMTRCCSHKFDLCMLQGADKAFVLTDAETADFSTASEITFDVWQNGNTGASLLSYSLTGGEISQPTDYQIAFTVPNSDSTGLPAGHLYAEAWVTFSDGSQIGAKGSFKVENTRKHD